VSFELQPHLSNQLIRIEPLREADFEALFAVASDPLIWEQHPNRDRYQREVFLTFFRGALESQGAFCVFDHTNGALIGSSRYYDYAPEQHSICVGYTFIARSRWAHGFNRALKQLMLDHAFRFVDRVLFHVGATNWRSRKAMEKLGGILIGEEAVTYYGEVSRPNVVFKIDKADWAAS
jgi:RimJ/RimL family protein N-acetyltransferase